jgi:hypothetical protein
MFVFDHAKIRSVVRQGFERAGLQAENLSTKLDAQHRDELAFHGAHQRALISTLHANHNEISKFWCPSIVPKLTHSIINMYQGVLQLERRRRHLPSCES